MQSRIPKWAAVTAFVGVGILATPGDGGVDFDREIQPLLSDHCFACHGPDGAVRKAGLRFDLEESAKGLMRDGVRAPIVPGDPEASEAWLRMSDPDPMQVMPPPDAHKPLTSEQIEVVRRWILEGAPWARHWAFVPPAASEAAAADSAVHPIDREVRVGLAERGLTPSPRADRRTLLRRLSLDLTGLPPTPEQIAEFLADEDPGAYERAVDRLLGSPRYGEHMARYWLDAVRYADTHGFHFDNYREIWPYRDWVVNAFNRNVPYDEFSTWQLAGDLLPDPTRDQRIATGYLRCNPTTNEGGIIDEEYRVEYAVDRVNNFGTVWLGLTVSCAQCHDHKFDPISQEEYFRLLAFFDNTVEAVRDENRKDPAPVLKVPRPEQSARIVEIQAALADLNARMFGPLPDLDPDRQEWESRLARAEDPVEVEAGHWWRLGPFPHEGIEEPYAHDFGPERAPFDPGVEMEGHRWTLEEGLVEGVEYPVEESDRTVYFARTITASRSVSVPVSAGSDDAIKIWVNGRVILDRNVQRALNPDSEQFSLRLAPGPNQVLVKVVNFVGAGGFVMRLDPAEALGLAETPLVDGTLPRQDVRQEEWNLVGGDPAPLRTDAPVRLQQAEDLVQHFYLEEESAPALEQGHSFYAWVYLDPEDPPRTVMLQFNNGSWDHRAYWGERDLIPYGRTAEDAAPYRYVGPLPEPGGWTRLEVDAGTVGLTVGDPIKGIAFTQYGGRAWWEAAGFLAPDDREVLARLAARPAEQRTEEQQRDLVAAFRRDRLPEFEGWEAEHQGLKEEDAALEAAIPVTLVAAERSERRQTRILIRGRYDLPGEPVQPGVPAVLPPWPDGAPSNRLGLAQWLFRDDHPLAARAAVNRFWQQLFGVGLVKTPEDLGIQGDRPVYPDLLDDLAVDFVQSGWDIKELIRLIVTSETYAQSARRTDPRHADDPENLWLSRASRFRLDAEVIRDGALAVSGLLVDRRGGPPVKPYQPEGLWEAVAFERSDTARYEQDTGEALYRRSMYTFWKRTAPPSALRVLDAPSREFCVIRRERTNTPLAALALMNDVTFVEAARVLAERTLQQPAPDEAARIRGMFERVTGRMPTSPEFDLLAAYLAEQRAAYAAAREQALALLSAGESPRDESLDPAEHAAWTMTATLLLNLDETLNKG